MIQNLHDINKNDRDTMERIVNDINLVSNTKYKLQTVRERQQRWLVVQRASCRVNAGLEIFTPESVPVLIAVLKHRAEETTDWVNRACYDTIKMLLCPSI